jgi:hypothetical protein
MLPNHKKIVTEMPKYELELAVPSVVLIPLDVFWSKVAVQRL